MVKKSNSCNQNITQTKIRKKSYIKLADEKIAETKKNVDEIEKRILEIHNKITFLL